MRDHCALNDQTWKTRKCAGTPNIRWDLIQTSRVFQASASIAISSRFPAKSTSFWNGKVEKQLFASVSRLKSHRMNMRKQQKIIECVPLAEPPGIHPMSKQVQSLKQQSTRYVYNLIQLFYFFSLQFTEWSILVLSILVLYQWIHSSCSDSFPASFHIYFASYFVTLILFDNLDLWTYKIKITPWRKDKM